MVPNCFKKKVSVQVTGKDIFGAEVMNPAGVF